MVKPPVETDRVERELAAAITKGAYGPPGTWLPSAAKLADRYDTSTMTARRAIHALAKRGTVNLHKEKGATVAAPRTAIARTFTDHLEGSGVWRGFLAAAHRTGREPFTKAIDVGDVEAPPDVAEQMGIPAGTAVLRRVRLQGTVENGRRVPGLLSTAWFRGEVAELIPQLREPAGGAFVPVRVLIAEAGLELRYRERVTCRFADAAERGRLELDDPACVSVIWCVSRDQMDQVVDVRLLVVDPEFAQLEYAYP